MCQSNSGEPSGALQRDTMPPSKEEELESQREKRDMGRSHQSKKELRDAHLVLPENTENGLARFGQETVKSHQRNDNNKT